MEIAGRERCSNSPNMTDFMLQQFVLRKDNIQLFLMRLFKNQLNYYRNMFSFLVENSICIDIARNIVVAGVNDCAQVSHTF